MTDASQVVGVKLVASGACLSRLDTGEIMFVDGLLPGESATVVETKSKGRTRFGDIVSVLQESPNRQTPPCKYVEKGCGGCDWQHIDVHAQHRYKREIVVDALVRIGKIVDAQQLVVDCMVLDFERYRTSARILASSNSWGFRARRSHEMVRVEDCIVLHPECVRQALDVVSAISEQQGSNDEGVSDEIHEAHVRRDPDVFRDVKLVLSKKSFFQGHIQAPEFLSNLILKEISDLGSELVCVDLYCGVGVFALALAVEGHRVIAVEGNPFAVGDAHKNLDGHNATVIHSDVKKFRFDSHSFGDKCDVVVADPSREGVSKDSLQSILSCKATRIVLISCDPAAGARDISLLVENGYELNRVIPVDMFGHTHHVEMVSVLNRIVV